MSENKTFTEIMEKYNRGISLKNSVALDIFKILEPYVYNCAQTYCADLCEKHISALMMHGYYGIIKGIIEYKREDLEDYFLPYIVEYMRKYESSVAYKTKTTYSIEISKIVKAAKSFHKNKEKFSSAKLSRVTSIPYYIVCVWMYIHTNNLNNKYNEKYASADSSISPLEYEILKNQMRTFKKGNRLEEEAKEEACVALKGFIVSMATKYYNSYMTKYREDLIQCGYLGVCDGIRCYNSDKGMPTTHFAFYIKHEMQTFLDSIANKTTTHYSTAINKINKITSSLEKANKPYTAVMISDITGIPLVTVNAALSIKKRVSTENEIDQTTSNSSRTTSEKILSPEEELIENENIDALRRAIDEELNEEEKTVLLLFYGVFGSNSTKTANIAKKLDKNTNEVKIIHKRALNKLARSSLAELFRDNLKNTLWLEPDVIESSEDEELETEEYINALDFSTLFSSENSETETSDPDDNTPTPSTTIS